jgi:hypothetical protein
MAENLNIDHPKIDDALKLLKEAYTDSITEMKKTPITEVEIKGIRQVMMKFLLGF